jgi:hypothetical protein
MPSHQRTATHATPPAAAQTRVLTIVVLALLFVLIVSLVRGSFRYAHDASGRNRAVMVMLKMADAFQKFKETKASLPVTTSDEATPIETKGPVLATLMAPVTPDDPASPSFLDRLNTPEPIVQNAQGEWELRDAWGSFFKIQVDLNGDGKIPDPASSKKSDMATAMPGGFIIYSAGPDGNFATWKDNVCSWK